MNVNVLFPAKVGSVLYFLYFFCALSETFGSSQCFQVGGEQLEKCDATYFHALITI